MCQIEYVRPWSHDQTNHHSRKNMTTTWLACWLQSQHITLTEHLAESVPCSMSRRSTQWGQNKYQCVSWEESTLEGARRGKERMPPQKQWQRIQATTPELSKESCTSQTFPWCIHLSNRQPKWHCSSITISSQNAFISSSAQKSSRGMASSLICHIIHPFIHSSYRWHMLGLFYNFSPVTTHSCLSSLPNCVVITTIVMAT